MAVEWNGPRAKKELEWLRSQHRPGGLLAVDERGKRLRDGSPCCLCGEPIDYDLRFPNTDSLTVQHVKSRDRFPELTWVRSNYGPAHFGCNASQGSREELPVGEFENVYW